MAEDLDKFNGEIMEVQAATLVSAHPESMPADLLTDAIENLYKVLEWMEDFPDALRLRSKYREQMRPALETERVGVVAYALSKLYRGYAEGLARKAKDIECRIAALETDFLGQSIQSDPEHGCPAVRCQIRKVKQSESRKVIDARVVKDVKRMKQQLRGAARDENKLLVRLWNRLDRHWEAGEAWDQRAESAIDEALRRRLEETEYEDEGDEATKECFHQHKSHLRLMERWIAEYGEHVKALGSPIADVYAYSKQVRSWMRGWEAVWALQM